MALKEIELEANDVVCITKGKLTLAIRHNDNHKQPIHISIYNSDDDEKGKAIDVYPNGSILVY